MRISDCGLRCMHSSPRGFEFFNPKSAISNREPTRRVGVRRTNLKSPGRSPRTTGFKFALTNSNPLGIVSTNEEQHDSSRVNPALPEAVNVGFSFAIGICFAEKKIFLGYNFPCFLPKWLVLSLASNEPELQIPTGLVNR